MALLTKGMYTELLLCWRRSARSGNTDTERIVSSTNEEKILTKYQLVQNPKTFQNPAVHKTPTLIAGQEI